MQSVQQYIKIMQICIKSKKIAFKYAYNFEKNYAKLCSIHKTAGTELIEVVVVVAAAAAVVANYHSC